MRPRLLDLFCCEGGAAMGYHRAGFDVVGVDIEPRPRYPFPFVEADALNPPFRLSDFDAIHASPPCQLFTTLRHLSDKIHPELIEATRDLLRSFDGPWVIENVVGAPLRSPVMLCGSSFGLKVRRHRLFESNVSLMTLPCRHKEQGTPLGVYGTGGGGKMTRGTKATPAEAREAMEMPWASRYGTSQAIPPAYTEFIGGQLLAHLQEQAA